MAIFGTFLDVSLPDVMSMVACGTGRLEISQQEGKYRFDLDLTEGTITHVYFNGQEIYDPDQALSFIANLVRGGEGEFEFSRCPVTEGPHHFRVTEVLLSSISMVDEIRALRKHFALPHVVFELTAAAEEETDIGIGSFWKGAYPYLKQGASAADLYLRLGLYLDQIQLKLYKLRNAGLIKPREALRPESTDIGDIQEAALEQGIEFHSRQSLAAAA
jgi:hypothetical protein